MAQSKLTILSASNYHIIVIKIGVSEKLPGYMKSWRIFINGYSTQLWPAHWVKILSLDKQNKKEKNQQQPETSHDAEGMFPKASLSSGWLRSQRPAMLITESGTVRLNTSGKMGRVAESLDFIYFCRLYSFSLQTCCQVRKIGTPRGI